MLSGIVTGNRYLHREYVVSRAIFLSVFNCISTIENGTVGSGSFVVGKIESNDEIFSCHYCST